jgi:hypothetical protein
MALKKEVMADEDMRQIPQEVEAGQCPEWKDILDHSPVYKSYEAKWKSLAVRDGMLQHQQESVNG